MEFIDLRTQHQTCRKSIDGCVRAVGLERL
jgi:hypothetical protein